MSPAELATLVKVRDLAGRGRFEVIGDASAWGLGGLGLHGDDVRNVLMTATACEHQGDHVLVRGGLDLEGVERRCRVRFWDGLVSVEGIQ